MPQGRPLDDTVIAAILASIDAGKSRNEIAREHGVSASSVSRTATANGRSFDRSKTKKATCARTADMKARRSQLAEVLLGDVDRLRARAWSEYEVIVPGRDGADIVTLKLPPLRDVQAAYTAIGIAVDKHDKLIKMDSDNGADEARSMLGALAEGLRVAYEQLPPEQ